MSDINNVLKWLRLLDAEPSEIFWGCLFAITASTFLTLHPNAPASYPPSTSSLFLRRWWDAPRDRVIRRQIQWSFMVIIAPELLVSLAFGDWRASKVGAEILHRFGSGRVVDWTRVHASFANMRGLVFEMRSEGEAIPDSAPYKYNSGIVRLAEIYQEMRRPTRARLADFLKSALLKPFAWCGAGLYFVLIPLLRVVRLLRDSVGIAYEWLSRIIERTRGIFRPDLIELDDTPHLGSRLEEQHSQQPASGKGSAINNGNRKTERGEQKKKNK